MEELASFLATVLAHFTAADENRRRDGIEAEGSDEVTGPRVRASVCTQLPAFETKLPTKYGPKLRSTISEMASACCVRVTTG